MTNLALLASSSRAEKTIDYISRIGRPSIPGRGDTQYGLDIIEFENEYGPPDAIWKTTSMDISLTTGILANLYDVAYFRKSFLAESLSH